MKRRFGAMVLVGALAVAYAPCEVFGQQLRVPQPSRGTIGRELNTALIANSAISQNFAVGRSSGFTPPPASGAAAPIDGVSFLIRPGEVGGDLVGSRKGPVARARAVGSSWTQSISGGGVSRYFKARAVYRSSRMQRGLNEASLLLDPQMLLATTAFSAPARVEGVSGGRAYDVLSSKDNIDVPLYSSTSFARSEGQSQTDMLESHLDMEHDRHLKKGWEWYNLGEYARARNSFKTAEGLDRSDPESRAGSFFCAIAQQRFSEAVFGMRKIMTWDGRRNVFKQDFKLLDRSTPKDEALANREGVGRARLAGHVSGFVKFAVPAGTGTASPLAMASVAYALWHGGQQEEAIHAAQTLLEMDPGGTFAQLLDNMMAAQEDSLKSVAD